MKNITVLLAGILITNLSSSIHASENQLHSSIKGQLWHGAFHVGCGVLCGLGASITNNSDVQKIAYTTIAGNAVSLCHVIANRTPMAYLNPIGSGINSCCTKTVNMTGSCIKRICFREQ